MACSRQSQFLATMIRWSTGILALTLLVAAVPQLAQPQTFQVIHPFTGGADGANPEGPLTIRGGNLYGTTYSGGSDYHGGQGVVFKMSNRGAGWTFSPIFTFNSQSEGDDPANGVVLSPDGVLYGTTRGHSLHIAAFGYAPTNDFFPVDDLYGAAEANGVGDGTVFELSPSGSGWTENTLHSFIAAGGYFPRGDLIFDPAGNLYGTTELEGPGGGGTVFELTPTGNGWMLSHGYGLDGFLQDGPLAGVVRDSAGNLYGTGFQLGSNNVGLVFKLTPSNGGWTYTLLHEFATGDGGMWPTGSLVLDAQGNLYGTAGAGGAHSWGVVWEITP